MQTLRSMDSPAPQITQDSVITEERGLVNDKTRTIVFDLDE